MRKMANACALLITIATNDKLHCNGALFILQGTRTRLRKRARPISYFKTIYAYIDTLGMLYIYCYMLLHAIYTTSRTTVTLFIRFGLGRIVEKKYIYFSMLDASYCFLYCWLNWTYFCMYENIIVGYGLTFYSLNQSLKPILFCWIRVPMS